LAYILGAYDRMEWYNN